MAEQRKEVITHDEIVARLRERYGQRSRLEYENDWLLITVFPDPASSQGVVAKVDIRDVERSLSRDGAMLYIENVVDSNVEASRAMNDPV